MWYLVAISLVVGLVCGYLVFRFSGVAAKKSQRLDAELKLAKDELMQYRARVNTHFSKTAELVNAMTVDYRAMYGHLAAGAQQLCDGEAMKLESMNPEDTVLTAESEEISATEEETVTAAEVLAEPASEDQTPKDQTIVSATEAKPDDKVWQSNEIPPVTDKPAESGADTRIH